jgi:hypothetical protein
MSSLLEKTARLFDDRRGYKRSSEVNSMLECYTKKFEAETRNIVTCYVLKVISFIIVPTLPVMVMS